MRKDQASPTPANSLNPSDSSDGTKTSLPTRGTIQDFYQLIYPWYQSHFEHYLVYILAMKLWLQKGKMTFWHRMAMIFYRLWRKLVKMKFFSWKLQTRFFSHMQLRTTSLLKGLPRKSLKLTLSMSLKYTAHFTWDPSLGQIRIFKKGGKGSMWRKSKRHFKSQVENCDLCLSVFMYVSVCVLGFFDNITEVVNKF